MQLPEDDTYQLYIKLSVLADALEELERTEPDLPKISQHAQTYRQHQTEALQQLERCAALMDINDPAWESVLEPETLREHRKRAAVGLKIDMSGRQARLKAMLHPAAIAAAKIQFEKHFTGWNHA